MELAVKSRMTREEACELAYSSLVNLRKAILSYHQLGLTIRDLHLDLREKGWTKSIHTLRKAQTELRVEGLLPPAKQGRRTDVERGEKSSHFEEPAPPARANSDVWTAAFCELDAAIEKLHRHAPMSSESTAALFRLGRALENDGAKLKQLGNYGKT